MFQLPGRTDDGALAVAVNVLRGNGKCCNQAACHVHAEGLQVVHEGLDVRDVFSGEGIFHDGKAPGTRRGLLRVYHLRDKISSRPVTIFRTVASGMNKLLCLRRQFEG